MAAEFKERRIRKIKFENHDFSSADIRDVTWKNCSFDNCRFENTIFKNAVFINCRFTNLSFNGCRFEGCQLAKIRGGNRAFLSRYNSKIVFLSGPILIFPLSGPAILSIINIASWILTAAGFIIAVLPGKWMRWNFAGIRYWPCPIGGTCSGALIIGNIKTRWRM